MDIRILERSLRLALIAGALACLSELNLAASVSGQPSIRKGEVSEAGQISTTEKGNAPGNCSKLAAESIFEEITPPEVRIKIDSKQDAGTFAIAVDPVHPGTIYVGTIFSKLWKSTDCGATWNHISTGKNGTVIDRGLNWTLVIDPQDPNIIYTNSGYGSSALYKSINGGVDWDEIWPPRKQPNLAKSLTYNFANVVALDPADHLHVLLTFHESCLPPHTATCIAESKDGGATWRLMDGNPDWKGGEGQIIYFLGSSDNWLWGSESNGFWRTADQGTTWDAISGMSPSHLQGAQMHRRNDGTFFIATINGIWQSPDGKPKNWRQVPNTGPITGGLVSTGTRMYASTCFGPGMCVKAQYLSSSENDGTSWLVMKSPDKIHTGGTLAYDHKYQLLYSSNIHDGLWRVVVP
jgi:hypothetical protein